MKIKHLSALTSLVIHSFVSQSLSQTPAELLDAQAGGIKLVDIRMEQAVLPNSTEPWIKLICTFTTEKDWTDIVSLNYEAIVNTAEGGQRLLTGGVSYINIPKGTNRAIMYLTPNTLKRFGKPQAVSVFAYRGDLPIGETALDGSRTFSFDEKALMMRFDGALQNVRFTPWIIYDFGKTPDLAAIN